MGRQINFYMDEETQNQFLDFIKESQFEVFSYSGEKIDDMNDVHSFYLHKKEFGELLFRDYDKSVNVDGPVIEVDKTIIRDKKIYRGRVYISTTFYNDNVGTLDYCKKYIDEYQKLYRWIKKHVSYQELMIRGVVIKEYANDMFVNIEQQGFEFRT